MVMQRDAFLAELTVGQWVSGSTDLDASREAWVSTYTRYVHDNYLWWPE